MDISRCCGNVGKIYGHLGMFGMHLKNNKGKSQEHLENTLELGNGNRKADTAKHLEIVGNTNRAREVINRDRYLGL